LGMAGEVADAACRIFTRAFYQSLLDRQPVPVATARGRRAAMLYYKNYSQNVEWTRPTLFVRRNAPSIIDVNRQNRIVAAAAFRFRQPREPAILCDRFESIEAYQKYRSVVRADNYRSALAYEVPDDASTVQVPPGQAFQIGKTRLLDELAALAVLDGFLPCVFQSGEAFAPPTNFLNFAIRLADRMDYARAQFKDLDGKPLLDQRKDSTALMLASAVVNKPYHCDLSTPADVARFNVAKQAVVREVDAL